MRIRPISWTVVTMAVAKGWKSNPLSADWGTRVAGSLSGFISMGTITGIRATSHNAIWLN